MAADDGRPLRHESNQQAARDGHHDYEGAAVQMGERGKLPSHPMEERQVGEQGDEVNQHVGRAATTRADQRGQHREHEQTAGRSDGHDRDIVVRDVFHWLVQLGLPTAAGLP